MILQGTAIPNLIIEVIGIMICVFALIMLWNDTLRFGSIKKYMTIAFSSMLLYNLCLFGLELSQSDRGGAWRLGVYLVGFGTYLFPQITAYSISRFVVRLVSTREKQRNRLVHALSILMVIGLAALLLVQFTGKLMTVDDTGKFYYGPASQIGFLFVSIFMFIDIIVLLRLGQTISREQRYAFVAYLLLPILGIGIRRFWPGIYIVALTSCISMMILLIVIIRERSRSIRKQELDNEQLKVDLMLSQIQPHFLFNVLYVIQEICLIDAEMASKAIADFSMFLRHNMDSISVNRPISIKEELEHVKHYVSLQQLRFGDALDVKYELGCTEFELPTLTLQPLVENAIRYGVRKSEDGEGTVIIRTTELPDHYEVHVIDNGPGFVPDELPDDGFSHMGLKNVQERLGRISGGKLIVDSVIGEGTNVTIVLPKSE